MTDAVETSTPTAVITEPAPTPATAPVSNLVDPAAPVSPVEPAATPPAAIDPAAIKIPEGATVDQTELTNFTALLSDDKLSAQERAQSLIDKYAELTTKAQEAQAKMWIDRQAKARAAFEADPEIGGANLAQSQTYFTSLLSEFGSEALVNELTSSGLANSLEFGRFLVKIGKLTAEGKPVVGAPTSGNEPASAAEKLYPNQGKL